MRQIALRGMGNLVKFDISGDTFTAIVDNAIPPLLVAGILQGIFELITGRGSAIEYSRDASGTLTLTAQPA